MYLNKMNRCTSFIKIDDGSCETEFLIDYLMQSNRLDFSSFLEEKRVISETTDKGSNFLLLESPFKIIII